MIKRAFVVENKGKMSHVLVYRSEACGSCASCGACNVKPQDKWLRNSLNAQPGDVVELEISDKDYYFSIFRLYVLPLLLFVGGIFTTHSFTKEMGQAGQALALLGGFVGLLVFFIISRLTDPGSSGELIRMADIYSSEGEDF